MSSTDVVALIPARSGSKSLPDKNIRDFAGKPLIAHSIRHALEARTISRVIVSTDSEQYAAIARSFGAETPFLRPAELATDDATDLVVFQHALQWLQDHEGSIPGIIVHLRPTYPHRRPEDVDAVVELLLQDASLDAVRSVAPAPATPYKMWTRGADGLISPVAGFGTEAYNQPRQSLPDVFLQNACIDAVRTRVIREEHSMTGRRIYGYLMSESFDIDSHVDLEASLAQVAGAGKRPARTFCFDIDGVIASLVPANDYHQAQPHADVIAVVNRLHGAGCRIVLCTARGSLTGIDWKEQTESQLASWGVRYHQLVFGKPAADYYIDDRAITIPEALRLADIFDHNGQAQD